MNPLVPIVVRSGGDDRVVSCTSWADLQQQVGVPDQAFVWVDPAAPWSSGLPPWPGSGTVVLLPLDVVTSDTSSDTPTRQPTTLTHFLEQPDAKGEYFLRNPSYQERLQADVQHVLLTFQPTSSALLLALVNKLETLLSRDTEHGLLYRQWVVDLGSLGAQLPPPVATTVRRLSQRVFHTLLEP